MTGREFPTRPWVGIGTIIFRGDAVLPDLLQPGFVSWVPRIQQGGKMTMNLQTMSSEWG
jgi:hypothetical protein